MEVPFARVGQSHPSSTKQVASQPSKSTRLKSSQPSSEVLNPSPQTEVQVEAVLTSPPVQEYPQAGALQRALHFVESTRFPSSQNSNPTRLPSPHFSSQTEGITELSQVHPVSI